MKTFLRTYLFLFSFLISLLVILFCDCAKAQNAPQYGGQLVLSTITNPKSFNPIVSKEANVGAIMGLVFEGLTKTDGVTTEVEPNLAKSWQVDESGKVWTFKLREDVSWSDDELFTADDVVFTFNRLIYNKDIDTSARDIFTIEGKIFKVEKVDKFTVKFTLPVKFAPFLRSMGHEILPKHILEGVVEEGKFNSHWGLDTNLETIVGTGPFKLSQYLPGERIILVRNHNYWMKDEQGRRLPYIDKITYIVVQNQDVALLKFQQKEIDFYGLRGQDFPILKPQEKEGNFQVYNTGPGFGTNFLIFNQNLGRNPKTKKLYVKPCKLKLFTNLKFRQAVAHSIDKQSIVNIVMNGLGSPQYSAMSPSSGFFHNPEVKKYAYSLDKAKQLLNEIGIDDRDGDGKAEDAKGKTVEFNLFTNAENTQRLAIANIIKKDLEQLGFTVNFVPLAFNQLASKFDSSFDWDAIILGFTGGIEPHFGSNVWQSSGHLHAWYPKQKEPATEWEAEIDQIFNQAVQELDRNKRKVFYDRWQEIVAEKLPLIYTALPASIFAVRNKFGNLNPTPYGGAFHNLEKIYIINDK